ncbi:MAG: exonuclease SbcCD subunit D [Candidatus Aenigmarchaeota archaeon]|nr:exonuclease SbcCD subunit D [Candidatus Aenigmarchaeota archaeon]
MKFAHFSDVHLGSWSSHPEMHELALQTFEKSMDICLAEPVDFILIAGDLFDTSLPSVDVLRRAAVKFRQCREAGVAVYVIPGSHDFSPTGKTFINVLEDAGLVVNVAKGSEANGKLRLQVTEDTKTGAKLCGVVGRAGALESRYFEQLDRSVEQENGFKIFMFHSAIAEYKPEHLREMPALPLSLLPRGFDYYAAGHVHHVFEKDEPGFGKIVFPGALFPTEFAEIEKYDPGFFIVEQRSALHATRRTVKLHNVLLIDVAVDNKTPKAVEAEIHGRIAAASMQGSIVLLRVRGVLDGRPSGIDFRSLCAAAYMKGAFAVKRSTSQMTTKELEQIQVRHTASIEELEKMIIREHVGKIRSPFTDEGAATTRLMEALNDEKQEGEYSQTYEERILGNARRALGMD